MSEVRLRPGVVLDNSEVQELRKKWVSPEVLIGMPVLFSERKNSNRSKFGTIVGYNRQRYQARILVPEEGRIYEPAYHTSDPILLGRVGQQGVDSGGGCWDYTEYHHRSIRFIAELEKRVAAIEKQMATGKPAAAPSQPRSPAPAS